MEKKCVTQHRLEQDRRVQVTESGRERFATLERVQHERCGVYELRRYEDDSGSLCHLLGAVSKGFGVVKSGTFEELMDYNPATDPQ
ncbi:hypothetical protein ACSBR2_021708 [Camellia fascicularis]